MTAATAITRTPSAETLLQKSVHLVDVGTSGGVWGLEEGYSMMVGGDADAVARLRPALETLAPGPEQGWGRALHQDGA